MRILNSVKHCNLPEHCGHRVVPHIVRNPYSSPEQLDSEVLVSAGVEEDSVLRRRGKDDGDVSTRLNRKGLHLDIGRVVREAHAREIFAALSFKNEKIIKLKGDVTLIQVFIMSRSKKWRDQSS